MVVVMRRKRHAIVERENGVYDIYTYEEMSQPVALRYPEWEGCASIEEAMDWIDSKFAE